MVRAPTHLLVCVMMLLLQGVGGTVQYPRGYLKKAYEAVRQKGGLCIADEVRAGERVDSCVLVVSDRRVCTVD